MSERKRPSGRRRPEEGGEEREAKKTRPPEPAPPAGEAAARKTRPPEPAPAPGEGAAKKTGLPVPASGDGTRRSRGSTGPIQRPSSADAGGRALEDELRAVIERFKELFGGEGIRRAETLFAEYQRATPSSRLNRLLGQKGRLLELMEINRALSSELDLDRLLEQILDAIVTLVGAEQAFLVLYDERGRMRVAAHRNLDKETLVKPEHEVSRSIVERAKKTGEIVHCHDALDDERFDGFLSVSNLKLRSILCVPFKARATQEVIGVLYVENREKPRAFDPDDVQVIEAFSHQAAIALSNARLRAEILAKNRNLRTLYEVGKAISSTLERGPLLELIARKILEVAGASQVALLLTSEEGKLEVALGRNREFAPLPPRDLGATRAVRRAVEEKRTVSLSGEAGGGASSQDAGASAVVVVPMQVRSKKELLGVVHAARDAKQPPFGAAEVELVEQLADQAAIALYNASLYERATVDSLTGVFKRSYFDQRLKEEVHRARRYGGKLSLLMLDLDHFKALNDTHGHLAGDDCLRLVGRIIKRSVRDHDVPSRYGGEEFAVIMPHVELAGAVKVAKRIQRGIALQKELPHAFTASIGVAEYQPELASEEMFLSKSDRALYRAKQTGRNKVCVWRPRPLDIATPS